MTVDLAQEAISKALSGDWKSACLINQNILNSTPNDIDALNRLARAYSELGKLKKAKSFAQKVLIIDPFNSIASKAIEKWKKLKKGETYCSKPLDPQTFLEEPGKTKIASLMHLGSPKILAKIDAGDEVFLNTHCHKVYVSTKDGKYIGRISDDLSARLRRLIQLGNVYQVCIKSIKNTEVKIFIREVVRSKKLSDTPSFTTEKIDYVSFTPPELVHNKIESDYEISESEEE